MTLDEPYFMTNIEWYEFSDTKGKYVLTKKAPPKAVKSYKEFYKALEQDNI
jgi:hypothetical protein